VLCLTAGHDSTAQKQQGEFEFSVPQSIHPLARVVVQVGRRTAERKAMEETPIAALPAVAIDLLTESDRGHSLESFAELIKARAPGEGEEKEKAYSDLLDEMIPPETPSFLVDGLYKEWELACRELNKTAAEKRPAHAAFLSELGARLLRVHKIDPAQRLKTVRDLRTRKTPLPKSLLSLILPIALEERDFDETVSFLNEDDFSLLCWYVAHLPDERMEDLERYRDLWIAAREDIRENWKPDPWFVPHQLHIANRLDDKEWVKHDVEMFVDDISTPADLWGYLQITGHDELADFVLRQRSGDFRHARVDPTHRHGYHLHLDGPYHEGLHLSFAEKFADADSRDQFQAFARLVWALTAEEV